MLSVAVVVTALLAGSGVGDPAVVSPGVTARLDAGEGCAKVWVLFRDKGVCSPDDRRAAEEEALARLTPRAVDRRERRRTGGPGVVDERDFDIPRDYVAAVAATGVELCIESRWADAVSVRADAAQVAALARLPFVRRIEPVRRGGRCDVVPTARGRAVSRPGAAAGGSIYGLAEAQLAMIEIPALHDAGYTGDGIVIGVLDTGFARTHEAFNEPGHEIDVLAEYDFVDDDPVTSPEPGDPVIPSPHGDIYQHAHGTAVLGTIAAYEPDVLVGGAPDASFVLAKTEDVTQEVPAEEDQFAAGLEFVEAQGADLSTSSLGYIAFYDWFDLDGTVAVCTVAMNAATDNGLVCVTAAGNGSQDTDLPSLIPPGDAFDAITVGALSPNGDPAGFSSFGPTFDGRVKPEVMALGEFVATVDPIDDGAYAEYDGTSMSTPLVASAVALLLEAHPAWTTAQLRTALFETASIYVATGTFDPAYISGYGTVDAAAAAQVSFCTGDLDGTGDVGFSDIILLLAAWGPCPGCPADLDGGGDVGFSDLILLLAAWGNCE